MRSAQHIGKASSATLWGRAVTAALLLSLSGWATLAPTTARAIEPGSKADDKKTDDMTGTPPDMLVFPDGRTIEGWILVQTPTMVKFRGVVKGMTFEREYQRSEILSVKKGINANKEKPADKATPAAKPADTKPAAEASETESAERVQKYYWIDLKGSMGTEISQKPLRDAFKDAKQQNADVVIISLDAKWEFPDGEKAPNEAANFDGLFRAEPMTVVLTEEVERDWVKPPKIVFWVKQAMGGAAFLPLVSQNIYFHSEGRMGGLGNLGNLFDGMGDDVVREKQRSLRLGHAEGWALRGGYDPRLIRAMARAEYVLSYRIKDGKVELFEGYPTAPGEELLTDDGKEDRKDTINDSARGTGNDVLTLNARIAKILGVSKGTVDTKDDLLSELNLDRSGKDVSNKSNRIMKDWSEGISNAKRELEKLRDDLSRGPQGKSTGNARDDSRKALGQRRAILERMKRIQDEWAEALDKGWLGRNGIPDVSTINVELERIRQELMKLK